MLTDQTRRELLGKLGLGAAAVLASAPARALAAKVDGNEFACKPRIVGANRDRSIDVVGAAPGQAFTFRVRATTQGFILDNNQVVPALDPDNLGITRDRRGLELGIQVSSGNAMLIGLDSILADSNSGRCHYTSLLETSAAELANPASLSKHNFLRF